MYTHIHTHVHRVVCQRGSSHSFFCAFCFLRSLHKSDLDQCVQRILHAVPAMRGRPHHARRTTSSGWNQAMCIRCEDRVFVHGVRGNLFFLFVRTDVHTNGWLKKCHIKNVPEVVYVVMSLIFHVLRVSVASRSLQVCSLDDMSTKFLDVSMYPIEAIGCA